jgi:lipid A oxidase
MTLSTTGAIRHPHGVSSGSDHARTDRMGALLGLLALAIMAMSQLDGQAGGERASGSEPQIRQSVPGGPETVVAGYAGAPFYHRSDLTLRRPGGTDMTLKRLGWDGDALYFPIDGGVRVVRWNGMLGWMVDFMHNKAVARLGKGAHGRKIKNGVVDHVETDGTLKGKPAPSPLRLTDVFNRLEFTHGHNTLMLTGLVRLMPLASQIRPYVGIGAGAAVPHVEVRFAGEKRWTSQYQYAGPSAQLLAGLEIRSGRGSFFLEYKFIWASISAALTRGHSWSLKKLKLTWLPRWLIEPFSGLSELPGDLSNQLVRWRKGEKPVDGTIQTQLLAHTVVVGGGYVWPGGRIPAQTGPKKR